MRIINKHVSNQIRNQIRNQVRRKLYKEIRDSVPFELRDQVVNKTFDHGNYKISDELKLKTLLWR